MGVLEKILSTKLTEVEALKGARLPAPPARRAVALSRRAGDPLRLITEIKRASPSAGALSTKLSVAERAASYERAGATMLSVLCDSVFFAGSYQHLAEAREACSLPLLCKEFVIHERQLDAARAWGADAVLLIVRCLSPERLIDLVEAAKQRDLVPFVEVATEEEAVRATATGATLVGVNARDLDSLQMDRARAERVLGALPQAITRVHLSGIASASAVSEVAASGVDAALIGEVLMREDDPGDLLRQFVVAARSA